MWIFGKERQSLRIRKACAARAKYMDGPGTEEVEVRLLTDDGHTLDLQLKPQAVHQLINDLATAYEAICPPITRGMGYARWEGMQD